MRMIDDTTRPIYGHTPFTSHVFFITSLAKRTHVKYAG